MIEIACGDSLQWSFVRSEAVQHEALRELEAQGVTLHRWPDEVLHELEAKWLEVVEEEPAKDSLFARIWESYSTFRDEYAIWRDHGYLD